MQMLEEANWPMTLFLGMLDLYEIDVRSIYLPFNFFTIQPTLSTLKARESQRTLKSKGASGVNWMHQDFEICPERWLCERSSVSSKCKFPILEGIFPVN